MKKTAGVIFAVVAWWGALAQAQQFTPPQTKNAALRYWAAFAEMKDRPIDEATSKLMEDVLNGSAAWDEQRLGPIVEENAYAVREMQRATTLPECNWGLDYSLGVAMPLAHLPKARVLARLNALYGARQLARGDAEGAVKTWLAGLRFAQDVSKGVGLIAALSAQPAFMANLYLLMTAVKSGAVSTQLENKVRAEIRSLPPDGLPWVESIRFEAWADAESLKYLARAQDFAAVYKEWFRSAPPQSAKPPSAPEISAFRKLMDQVVAAFHLPPAQTRERLATITARLKNMNPAVQAVFPNYQRLNDRREKMVSQKEELLKALK
ncbi:MAG: hypothetical protein ACM3SW_17545 [Actinomycetota bacterium]